MPALAREFEVIAVDQRGIGLTGKPQDRYDTGTLAGDLVALLDALGHERFAWTPRVSVLRPAVHQQQRPPVTSGDRVLTQSTGVDVPAHGEADSSRLAP
jgi:hypothetical protein